jgi:hypothetical protein
MDSNFVGLFAMVCAGIAIVSTVVHYVLKFKELRVLREIRDRLDDGRRRVD